MVVFLKRDRERRFGVRSRGQEGEVRICVGAMKTKRRGCDHSLEQSKKLGCQCCALRRVEGLGLAEGGMICSSSECDLLSKMKAVT